MTLSLSKKNALSVMTMTLTMISLISPADAQTTCTSFSPDCCWVVQSWEKMGKNTSVSSSSATACCSGIPGVECRSSGIVTQLKWSFQGLQNSIPSELKNLRKLEELDLVYNGLNGSIPPELGNLTNLERLDLSRNELSGPIPSSLGNLAKLKELVVRNNRLTGPIPSSLGNLRELKELSLSRNGLNGLIPPELGNLRNLKELRLNNNTGLNGTFAPRCGTDVEVSRTKVIICGCAAASTPPTIFPPSGTHADCLASGPALTLAKRTHVSSLAYGQVIGGRSYTCHVDYPNQNPFADCTNSMAFLCNTTDTTWNSDGAKRGICRTAVNQMYGQMNDLWQAVRRECGQWQWTDGVKTSFTGSHSSEACATANSNLIAKAVYTLKDGSTSKVSKGFTNSQNEGLWSKVTAN